MTWTTPRTWVTSELVTSALMNTHVRDNTDDLMGRRHFGGPPIGATSANYYSVGVDPVSGSLTQYQAILAPFWVPKAVTIDRVSINVTAALASTVIRLGIYSDFGAFFPYRLVVDAGTVDSTTTGAKEATVSTALTPGTYWGCVVRQGTGAGTLNITTSGGGGLATRYDVGTTEETNAVIDGRFSLRASGITGALPANAPVTTPETTGQDPPRFVVRVA